MELWNFYRTENEIRKSRKRTEEWTIPAIRRFYDRSGIRLLSVGCGSAVDVAVLRERGYLCWGTDPDENCCAEAREFFVQADACSLPFDSEGFDVTMCMEALEHIGTPEVAFSISEKRGILRPVGESERQYTQLVMSASAES